LKQTGIFLVIIIALSIWNVSYASEMRQNAIIIGEGVNFRAEPDTGGEIITVLKQGSAITIMGQADNWYKARLADGRNGWIFEQFVKVELAMSDRIITFAKSLIGTKYVYGGQSTQGFDCSGFTMYVFAKFGIGLPHQADLQIKKGEEVPDKSNLIPGDLVFFKTEGSVKVNHVGIYLGDGRFVHASSGSGFVRISILDNGYYNQFYVGGRRLVN
jgi:uncharacterized protein YgiM (DUF1202 family)